MKKKMNNEKGGSNTIELKAQGMGYANAQRTTARLVAAPGPKRENGGSRLGFCVSVLRQQAGSRIRRPPSRPVCSLGPIIHKASSAQGVPGLHVYDLCTTVRRKHIPGWPVCPKLRIRWPIIAAQL